MRPLVIIPLILLLGGCTFGSVSELKKLNPQANDFASALAAEYLAYAESEQEQGHGLSAGHFAGKGLAAAKGKDVAPESAGGDAALVSARATLVALLTDDAKRVLPQPAARAQLLYDCWASQLSRDGAVPACAEEFQATLPELQKVVTSLVLGKEKTQMLSFAPKSSKLGDEAMDALGDIGEYVKNLNNYTVVLEGRGGSASSRRLLERRASAVRNVLAGLGVEAKRVQLAGGKHSKEVYLSCSDSITDPNAMRVTVRITGRSEPIRQESDL